MMIVAIIIVIVMLISLRCTEYSVLLITVLTIASYRIVRIHRIVMLKLNYGSSISKDQGYDGSGIEKSRGPWAHPGRRRNMHKIGVTCSPVLSCAAR